MKQGSKIVIYTLLAVTFFVGVACKKDRSSMGNAEIIGNDARECACCGGMEITIDHVSNPNGDSFF